MVDSFDGFLDLIWLSSRLVFSIPSLIHLTSFRSRLKIHNYFGHSTSRTPISVIINEWSFIHVIFKFNHNFSPNLIHLKLVLNVPTNSCLRHFWQAQAIPALKSSLRLRKCILRSLVPATKCLHKLLGLASNWSVETLSGKRGLHEGVARMCSLKLYQPAVVEHYTYEATKYSLLAVWRSVPYMVFIKFSSLGLTLDWLLDENIPYFEQSFHLLVPSLTKKMPMALYTIYLFKNGVWFIRQHLL
jgi:hypothetical protein